jgi:predicted RND superfamily exporter protein
MQKFFLFFCEKVVKRPVLTVFVAILITFVLVSGVTRIRMATGNETFIKTSTDIYQSNLHLGEMFGGENIVIHFKAEDIHDFLTVENMVPLDRLERALLENDNVYSVIGPATTLRHMTEKQAEAIRENVGEIRDGLLVMSERLAEISVNITEMADNASETDLSQTTGLFRQSSEAINKLISGQNQLGEGIDRLGSGYSEFGTMITSMGQNIGHISGGLEEALQHLDLPEQEKQMLLQKTAGLKQSAAALDQAGSTMLKISGEAQMLNQVPLQTVEGLTAMEKKLAAQSGQLQAMQNGLPDLGNLGEGLATFSAKLQTISEGLDTLLANSNIMAPGIPTSQDTLNMLLYDDGELRPMFAQMVIDEQNAVMMIRLTGNASDGQIEEVVDLVTEFMERNPLQNTETIVTGKPVLDIALRTEMKSSMQKMVISALILMVVIVSVVFKVRWRLLPLVVNFGAVVATMGLMGHLGIPMTMVSMAAFPILIGLGIDYSIQFHSRYEEEFMSEEAARS